MSEEITSSVDAEIVQTEEKPKRVRKQPAHEVVEEEKELIFMQSGAGWTTPSGVDFTREHPYKLVPVSEVPYLLKEERFKRATVEEVKRYYGK